MQSGKIADVHIFVVDEPSFAKVENASDELKIAQTDPDDYAFMLYTSGTTGKPKGVVHSHRAVIQERRTLGLICGTKTPLVHGRSGMGNRNRLRDIRKLEQRRCCSGLCRFDPMWYALLDKYNVTVWYTAPTAIRMLMAGGMDLVKKHNLSHLRHLCSVGEPLNPEAIRWGIKAFGLAFHDTWWQTETGAICIANYPCMDIKIGSMGKPIPGLTASIVDDKGKVLGINKEGNIALKPKWPSMMHTIWRRPQKYKSYFVNGWYLSGDHGMVDKDGYFWFIGRADDVIKTSGTGRALRSRVCVSGAPGGGRSRSHRETGCPARRNHQGVCRIGKSTREATKTKAAQEKLKDDHRNMSKTFGRARLSPKLNLSISYRKPDQERLCAVF